MNGGAADAIGLLAACLLVVPIVVLPGYAIAAVTNALDFQALGRARRWRLSALVGIALLPVVQSMVLRFFGMPAALAATAILGLAGAALALRGGGVRVDARACGLAALWFGIVAYGLIDIDWAGRLHQPLLVLDLVKHATTATAISETGAPPVDPFFAREGRAGYYYFFYTPAALAMRLGGILDGRAAFGGMAFWTGIGLLALVELLVERSGLVSDRSSKLVGRCLLVLMPAAGLDLVPVMKAGLVDGVWQHIPEYWNEQAPWWASSLLWVPHHVAGLMAAWFGLLCLADAMERGVERTVAGLRAVVLAALAFASCGGLSVWVALGAAASAGVWTAWLLLERRLAAAAIVVTAGLASLVVAAPHLADLLANRTESVAPIALTVRVFGPLVGATDNVPLLLLLRFIALPLNYYIEFGVFASGTILFWRLFGGADARRRETGRLLVVTGFVGLALGSFLASTILNNDLGWRVVLLSQMAALIWTAAALLRVSASAKPPGHEAATSLRMPGFMLALLILGYGTTAYGLVWLRAFPLEPSQTTSFINARPDIDRGLRDAYRWAAATLPPSAVLQHGLGSPRSLAFGLYGRHRVAVADVDATLYGASASQVAARIHDLLPIFASTMDASDVKARAAKAGIDALVVSADDPVFADRASWVWRSKARYDGSLVRIIAVDDL